MGGGVISKGHGVLPLKPEEGDLRSWTTSLPLVVKMHVLGLFWRNYRKEVVRRESVPYTNHSTRLFTFVSSFWASSMGTLAVRRVFKLGPRQLCANSTFHLIISNGDVRRWSVPSLDFGLGQTLCSNRSCQKTRDRCDTHRHMTDEGLLRFGTQLHHFLSLWKYDNAGHAILGDFKCITTSPSFFNSLDLHNTIAPNGG